MAWEKSAGTKRLFLRANGKLAHDNKHGTAASLQRVSYAAKAWLASQGYVCRQPGGEKNGPHLPARTPVSRTWERETVAPNRTPRSTPLSAFTL